MRIVLAPDSFKESISAVDVCATFTTVFREHGHEPVSVPIADGGEGTVDAVLAAIDGERVTIEVEGPLGDQIRAEYGIVEDGATAIIEMAAASGLHLVARESRDPMRASTFGTGQLIRDAAERGVSTIVVGLGGSATTDGGAGAAQALGVTLLDADGRPIGRGGEALAALERIDISTRIPVLDKIKLIAACDVTNPLVGPKGSARVYGPQKGATEEQVAALERRLDRFARIVQRDLGIAVAELPGAGAAGGLAAGLVALCGATIDSGFGTIAEVTELEEKIAKADCVVTGEGRYDDQTAHGKAVSGVCTLARRHGKPIHLIAGIVTHPPVGVFATVHELARYAGNPGEARLNPIPYLEKAAAAIVDAL